MKKTAIILLSVFYFVIASGFTVSLHYCAGKLKGMSLLQLEKDNCCGSKKKSMGCCKDKTLSYKVKDNHQAVATVIVPDKSLTPFIYPSYTETTLFVKPSIEIYTLPDFHAPPYQSANPVYLLNRTFRI